MFFFRYFYIFFSCMMLFVQTIFITYHAIVMTTLVRIIILVFAHNVLQCNLLFAVTKISLHYLARVMYFMALYFGLWYMSANTVFLKCPAVPDVIHRWLFSYEEYCVTSTNPITILSTRQVAHLDRVYAIITARRNLSRVCFHFFVKLNCYYEPCCSSLTLFSPSHSDKSKGWNTLINSKSSCFF